MYSRHLDLALFAEHKFTFMLGPRQTGKSTLLKTTFPQALYIDLLADEVFRQFSSAPEILRHAVGEHKIVDSPIHWEALRAYAGAYLREEIQAEALTRSSWTDFHHSGSGTRESWGQPRRSIFSTSASRTHFAGAAHCPPSPPSSAPRLSNS